MWVIYMSFIAPKQHSGPVPSLCALHPLHFLLELQESVPVNVSNKLIVQMYKTCRKTYIKASAVGGQPGT